VSGERLDDLDRRIVEKLARDARVSNRQIAAELQVTEGTIRSRIKRLQAERLIQFTVVTDFRLAGSPNLVMIGIQADPSRVATLAQQLADIKEIGCVIVLLGRYSLLAMGLFTNIEQLNELITSRIRSLEGVRDVETSISVHNVKYEVGIARITDRPPQPSE
jgi:DNA-binding Lrp family transcriptional regulator